MLKIKILLFTLISFVLSIIFIVASIFIFEMNKLNFEKRFQNSNTVPIDSYKYWQDEYCETEFLFPNCIEGISVLYSYRHPDFGKISQNEFISDRILIEKIKENENINASYVEISHSELGIIKLLVEEAKNESLYIFSKIKEAPSEQSYYAQLTKPFNKILILVLLLFTILSIYCVYKNVKTLKQQN